MAKKVCDSCGGEMDQHPWPEEGPYVRGCIKELKRQNGRDARGVIQSMIDLGGPVHLPPGSFTLVVPQSNRETYITHLGGDR